MSTWGILGCGTIANEMAATFQKMGHEIYGVANRTPEKAEKAMQLLHEAYIVHENFKKLDAEIQIEVLKKSAKRQLMYGGIFRFPKEEDL